MFPWKKAGTERREQAHEARNPIKEKKRNPVEFLNKSIRKNQREKTACQHCKPGNQMQLNGGDQKGPNPGKKKKFPCRDQRSSKKPFGCNQQEFCTARRNLNRKKERSTGEKVE